MVDSCSGTANFLVLLTENMSNWLHIIMQ